MAENNTVTLRDGRILGYAEYGDPKGKPIFYFHGWPASRLQARIADKSAKTLRIRLLSIDRPGFGLSTYQEKRTILDWSDDVGEFADILHIKKFAVMGVSGGGPYAAAIAYKIPQRLTRVGVVVGLAPTWIPDNLKGSSFTARFCWGNYAKYSSLRYLASLNYFISAYFRPLSYINAIITRSRADKKASYRIVKEFRRDAFTNHKETFRQGINGPMADLDLYTRDWGIEFDDIKTKVYLYYGEEDKNVSLNMGKFYHRHIPDSVLKVYPKEGHLCAVTHQEEILKELSLE